VGADRPHAPDRPASGPRHLEVRVKPSARASRLYQDETGAWRAELRAAPADGKANAELIALVAKHFQRPRSAVRIQHGGTGRVKLLRLE